MNLHTDKSRELRTLQVQALWWKASWERRNKYDNHWTIFLQTWVSWEVGSDESKKESI